ncbi:MAG: hypothetical protein R3178_03130 [Rhodothermales bacterium]|nr:hypothetical protein [Rhodothermales bacterium]
MCRARYPGILLLAAAIVSTIGCDTGGDSGAALDSPLLGGPIEDASFPARSLVEFSWSRVEGATAYEYDINYDDYPASNTSGVVLDTFHVEQLVELGTVTWRVRAHSAEGPGPWSRQRQVEAYGTEASVSTTVGFQISTQEAIVGDIVRVAAGVPFAAPLTAAIQSEGGSVSELREIRVTRFEARITSPAETTFDDFSEWTMLLVSGSAEKTIMAMTDPAPASETATLVFLEPEDWISLAVHPQTQLEISVRINPRSPRPADVQAEIRLDMAAVLNR